MKKLLLSGIFAVVLSLAFAVQANAATFVVNNIGDDSDSSPGDGNCLTVPATCTLRAAIEEANALAGPDIINFNIAGAGVQTITPLSALPAITQAVVIDGFTQTGAGVDGTVGVGGTDDCSELVPASLPAVTNTPHNLLIRVDATNIGFNSAFYFNTLNASNSVLRGLVVGNSPSSGVFVYSGVTDITIECNYIGTDEDGLVANGNSTGITAYDNVERLTIQNNLISGNTSNGIDIGSSAREITIQNNLVGTASDGLTQLANGYRGLQVTSDGQTANGSLVYHNVVSGNGDEGIHIESVSDLTVEGNYLGLNIEGSALGNTSWGLVVYGAQNFTVGGTNLNQRNYIASNGAGGIHIYRDCSSSYGPSRYGSVYNNYIGTNVSGVIQSGYGNQGPGIEVNEFQNFCASIYKIVIGGDTAGQANIIAGNSEQGILIHQAEFQDVFSITSLVNSIYGNGQFGIDLAAASDGGSGIADTDLGPNAINNYLMSYPTTRANYYINHPTINSIAIAGSDITVNYDFQANGVDNSNPDELTTTDLIGYRLDFYLNDAGQDGAYAGYSQGKTHLGSFIVDGSETGATHTFTSPIALTGTEAITSTTTVLWRVIPDPGNCVFERFGDGPPYAINNFCVQ